MAPTRKDFEVIRTIGHGSFGVCKLVKQKSDGKLFVQKEIFYGRKSQKEKEMVESEINLLRKFNHINIVRYYFYFIEQINTMVYIIMEYCQGGDLAAYIERFKDNRKYIDEKFIWKVFYQLATALNECHHNSNGQRVLHRDIKPANVFLDDENNVKLGDFGIARVLANNSSFASTIAGTLSYMSPEQMNGMPYNEKSDIWSFGCLMYELCALTPLFTASSQSELIAKIKAGTFSRIPAHFPADLNIMIKNMVTVKVDLRPSIDKILVDRRLLSHIENSESKWFWQFW